MSLVLVSRHDCVAVVRLNRPQARNALSKALIEELLQALVKIDDDPGIGAIVLTGTDEYFCAGADIKELKELNLVNAYMGNFLQNLGNITASLRKPLIGAINGFALGGGCELALMCDIVYAAHDARFGQPEVRIGTIPGAGGTQRLTRALGKSKAMHMILTGETISAAEAEVAGLVAKIFPPEQVLEQAVATATQIARYSRPVVAMAKEAVTQAEQVGLREGLLFESRLYHASFGLADCKEGMSAFVEKRPAVWYNA